jgi:hypothetical protein
VDVGNGDLGVAARADRSDRIALGDGRALRDEQRAQMGERDGVAVRREDRDALAGRRHGAGEGHGTGCGRDHGRPGVTRDVDAAMLPGGVRMRRVERVGLDDDTVGRPAPGRGGGSEEQRGQDGQRDEASHAHLRTSRCCQERKRLDNGRCDPPQASSELTKLSQSAAVQLVARHAADPRDDVGRSAPRRTGRD